jgi:hypothetical protein
MTNDGMTNDEGMPNPECRMGSGPLTAAIRH